jgi:excisionase family DNA binding protein
MRQATPHDARVVCSPAEIPSDLIRISRAAKLVDVNPSTIWRWCHEGRLRSWKLVGSRRVSRAELMELLRPVEAAPTPIATPPAERGIVRRKPLFSADTETVLRRAGYLNG